MTDFKNWLMISEWGHATFDHLLTVKVFGRPVSLLMVDLRLEDYGQAGMVHERWLQNIPDSNVYMSSFGDGAKRRGGTEKEFEDLLSLGRWGVEIQNLKEVWAYGGVTWVEGISRSKLIDWKVNPLSGIHVPVNDDPKIHELYKNKPYLTWWDFVLGMDETGNDIVKPPAKPRNEFEAKVPLFLGVHADNIAAAKSFSAA